MMNIRHTFVTDHKVSGTRFIRNPGDASRIGIALRPISDGDETALFPTEAVRHTFSVAVVRRRSGAARIAARALIRVMGESVVPIPNTADGMPIWPRGLVGSLAHDHTIAVAAIARSNEYASLGVDIEPDEPLPSHLVEIISTRSERDMYSKKQLERRDLFVLKEATYKASYPLFSQFLDFHDIEIDLFNAVAFVPRLNARFDVLLHREGPIVGLSFQRHLNCSDFTGGSALCVSMPSG